MINKLLNRKSLARTSSTPGKTISVNSYGIDRKLYFVDLPGYGFAARSKSEQQDWGRLIDAYFALQRDIRIIFFLVDIRHEPTENDRTMYDYLMAKEDLFCVVATKADKLKKTQVPQKIEALSSFFQVNVIPYSSADGQGVGDLQKIIEDVTDS